ncbi:dienelactone hydrolase family protein [Halalkalibacter alkalisediminis]|uniref:Dienelactone hydrolase family protein n=1 Tax=Halalkalibacter alkalisediminis TaxID=935616 RepID=A0ABV6NDQ1_9BACI|nr:alpha/beta hydrolase family protein [Halalkalibacter alkalisediminis]
MWSPDSFLQQLYDHTIQTHPTTYDSQWKINLKSDLQESLGDFTNFKVGLEPSTLEIIELDGYMRLRVELATGPDLKMPVYVLLPTSKSEGKRPAVLALHGHGYGSKEIVGLHPGGMENRGEPGIHKNFAVELVKKGVVVVAPELIGIGDRKLDANRNSELVKANSCFELASQLLLVNKTLAGLRVFECRRVLDYIEGLTDIDREKIGCMGLSGGALVAAFTSALDERIKATVISGYTNTFKGSIMSRRHCLDNYLPGILQYAELPELIGLSSPKPLFIEAGYDDHLFPMNEVQVALSTLKNIYKSEKALDSLSYHFFDGGHEICGEKSISWLVNSLIQEGR